MTKIPSWLIAIVVVALAVFGGRAMSAQDKYTVQVPNGLAFSEFKGYEDWQVVAVSQTEELIAVILANPVMIEAYRAGVPGNGTHFPDGSKIAKIHWKPKKSADAPAATTVPDVLNAVILTGRTRKKFRATAGGGKPKSNMTRRPTHSRPRGAA